MGRTCRSPVRYDCDGTDQGELVERDLEICMRSGLAGERGHLRDGSRAGTLRPRRSGCAPSTRAYAQDMNRFLQKSELTESRRAFIETFAREIGELLPDNAVGRYTLLSHARR